MARFIVYYQFRGRTTQTMEAASIEDAREIVERKADRDDFEIDADEVDDVEFTVEEMHPVTRNGREIWTTYVTASDLRGHQSALQTSPLFAVAA